MPYNNNFMLQDDLKNISKKTCTLIYLHSFSDYILLKMISNKEKLGDTLTSQIKDDGEVFNSTVTAVVFPSQLTQRQYNELLLCLQDQHIRFSENMIPPQNCQSFNSLAKKLFGESKYTLIKEGFYFANPSLKIEDHLFTSNQPYTLFQFKHHKLKGNLLKSEYWIVQCKQIQIVNEYSSEQGNFLIKLGHTVIINIYKLNQSFNKTHGLSTNCKQQVCNCLADQLQKLINLQACKIQSFAKAQRKLQFHLKIKVDKPGDIMPILQFCNSLDCLECLGWSPQQMKPSIIYFSDLPLLITNMGDRKANQLMSLNITKQGFRPNQSDDDQETKQSLLSDNVTINLIQDFNNMLANKKYDILALTEHWLKVKLYLTQIRQQWKMYEKTESSSIRNMITLLQYRLYKYRIKLSEEKGDYFYLYEHLSPQVTFWINQFSSVLKRQSLSALIQKEEQKKDPKFNQQQFVRFKLQKINAQNKLEENILDKLMIEFCSQFESIKKGSGIFYIKIDGFENKALKSFIGELIKNQQKAAYWEDIFNLITLNLKKILSAPQTDIDKIILRQNPNIQCLGCTDFLIMDHSIVRQKSKNSLRVFPDCQLGKLINELAQQFCFMLNNNGGIILFNVNREYYSVLPKGKIITESMKKDNRQIIDKIISLIYPKISLDQDIIISYVPITKPKDEKLLYINNLCSMRIKVYPKDKGAVYVWKRNNEDKYKNKQCMNKDKTQIDLYKLNRKIKQRQKKCIEKAKRFKPKIGLDHKCKPVKVFSSSKQNDEVLFHNLSMIVVKKDYIAQIERQFKRLKLDWAIEVKFHRYNFSVGKYTAVLFHNSSHEDVIKYLTNNNALKFQQKRVLAISITKYLKIESRQFSLEDLKNAAGWLKKQFAQEKLEYYTYPSQLPEEHYVKTGQKLSNLFMYYVFNHFKLKTIFKDPEYPHKLIQKKYDQRNQSLQIEQSSQAHFLQSQVLNIKEMVENDYSS